MEGSKDIYFGTESPGRQIDLYEALVQAQSDLGHGVTVYDSHIHRFYYVNDALAQIFGYTKEEFILLPSITTLIHPEDAQELQKRLAMGIGNINFKEHFEARGILKNGRIIHIESSFKKVEGAEAKFVMLFRDITEKKLTQLKLQACYEELQSRYHELEKLFSELQNKFAKNP